MNFVNLLNNTCFGHCSGQGHESDGYSGIDNTCIGYFAGKSLQTTGSSTNPNENTLVGSLAGTNITSGYDNTCVGAHSGESITTGFNNTCLGAHSGDSITTGDENVIIGETGDVSSGIDNNSIVIGFGATGNGTNTATIGNSSVADVYMNQNSNANLHARNVNQFDTYSGSATAQMDLSSQNTTLTRIITTSNYGNLIKLPQATSARKGMVITFIFAENAQTSNATFF